MYVVFVSVCLRISVLTPPHMYSKNYKIKTFTVTTLIFLIKWYTTCFLQKLLGGSYFILLLNEKQRN